MTDFKAKMHQIRFPQTPLGELTALAQTLATPLCTGAAELAGTHTTSENRGLSIASLCLSP